MRKFLLLIALLFTTVGCDIVYFHYTDCRYYNEPRFDRSTLAAPVLNQQYSDRVEIVFDNDRHINSHEYSIEILGLLPPGISYYRNNGTIFFEGTATSPGTYSFRIVAHARYRIHDRYYFGFYTDDCSYSTTQNYQLTVT